MVYRAASARQPRPTFCSLPHLRALLCAYNLVAAPRHRGRPSPARRGRGLGRRGLANAHLLGRGIRRGELAARLVAAGDGLVYALRGGVALRGGLLHAGLRGAGLRGGGVDLRFSHVDGSFRRQRGFLIGARRRPASIRRWIARRPTWCWAASIWRWAASA